jgi:hypothetical protein
VSSDDEYARYLERWAATALPVFRVADWDGTWLLGNSGGLGSIAVNGTQQFWGTMSQDVWHRRPDVRGDAITVTSSRPSFDEYSPQLGNMAIQICKAQPRDGATVEEQNQRMSELQERLSTGEFPWASANFMVDGVPTEFAVLIVGEVWFAFAQLDDVDIEILGQHTPLADLRLTRVAEPPPSSIGE